MQQERLRPAAEDRMPVIAVGMRSAGDDRFERSMAELAALASACGMQVVQTLTQSDQAANAATFIGRGKVEEVVLAAAANDAEMVIFNNALSPRQLKNLTDAMDRPVLDRTGLILRIFDLRARTREARLQVEYARLTYMLPRLAGLHRDLSRQAGTSGAQSSRGAGETQMELDRRRIESRMNRLERELDLVSRERATQRARRGNTGIPRVALVGYTNAGKSTLMNRLLEACRGRDARKVLEEDQLFATLDTTVRRLDPGREGRPFLLSDTVGFIDRLPTTLVKAFRSTLEETRFADLLLIVCDCSDEDYPLQLDVTLRTLNEIGAGQVPRITIYNKCDRAGLEAGDWLTPQTPGIHAPGQNRDGRNVTMNAKDPAHVARLLQIIETVLAAGRRPCTLLIPYDRGGLLARLQAQGPVQVLDYRPQGTLVRADLTPAEAGRLGAYIQDEPS